MNCPHMESALNDYVDGTLADRERASVEAHLAGCAACRAAVAELQALATSAASLPKSISPRRDLWAEIDARLVQRATSNVQRLWLRVALAAAAVVLAFGLYRLLPPSPALSRPGTGGWAAVQADFDRSTGELSRILATERDRLSPETVALLERNLRTIDAALAECRAALARDSADADLQDFAANAARQKVELLRWAVRTAEL